MQSGLEVRIGELDVTVGGKADVLMLEELEKSLRDELARLAKMGEGSISRDLLDVSAHQLSFYALRRVSTVLVALSSSLPVVR